jgi:hypothetical protein
VKRFSWVNFVSENVHRDGIGLEPERPYSGMDLTAIRQGTSGICESPASILSDRKVESEVYSSL